MKYDTVMIRVYVTDKGPIDNHAPGTDVSLVYRGDKLERLVREGFLAVVEDKPRKRTTSKVATKGHIDAVADDGSEDGE